MSWATDQLTSFQKGCEPSPVAPRNDQLGAVITQRFPSSLATPACLACSRAATRAVVCAVVSTGTGKMWLVAAGLVGHGLFQEGTERNMCNGSDGRPLVHGSELVKEVEESRVVAKLAGGSRTGRGWFEYSKPKGKVELSVPITQGVQRASRESRRAHLIRRAERRRPYCVLRPTGSSDRHRRELVLGKWCGCKKRRRVTGVADSCRDNRQNATSTRSHFEPSPPGAP